MIAVALVAGISGYSGSVGGGGNGESYTLTIVSAPGGSVITPGVGIFRYDEGVVVNLAAEADDGYRFVNWSGDVSTIANVNGASTVITMNADCSTTANFEQITTEQTPPEEFDLTTSSETGGSVTTPGEGTFTYDAGTTVGLVATPANGYQFVNWSGDVDEIANVEDASTTIITNGDYSITANFEAIPTDQYNLTASSTAGGSVASPGEGTFTYDAGRAVGLVATSANGYQFVNWSGDVGTVANVNAAATVITMNGDCSITANFEQTTPEQFDVTTSSGTGGSVTIPGEGTFTYDAGTVVSLVATPANGYQFVNWSGDVGTIANVEDASTTITTNGGYSITANFEQITPEQFDVTIFSSTGGSVTMPGEGTFTYDTGTVVDLVAAPASGYHFVSWTGDVDDIANVNAAATTITMNARCSIRADFLEDSPSPPGMDYTGADVEELIIALINAERQQSDLPALSKDSLLTSLAREHSASMVENHFFGHERYPGDRPMDYGQLPGTMRGENVAKIPTRQVIPGPYLSLQEVCAWAVSLWMNSSGHRANILQPVYTETGVGVSFSDGWDYLYITQIFEGAS